MLKKLNTPFMCRVIWGILFLSAAGFCAFFIWQEEISHLASWLSATFRESVKCLDGVPLVFYSLAILILPILFLPATPVYFLASARAETESFIVVLLFCWLGIILNIIVAYYISRYFGKYIRKCLSKRNISIPEVPEYEQYELTFLLRMIPGNPMAVQNYLLGLADIPFFKYVIVSIPVQLVQVAAYVYFGEGIFSAKASEFILGMSFLVILAVVARMLEKAYKKRTIKNGIPKK